MDANDTGHIWLRQTVTFTVDGQTRTLEIGIPVPRDATAQDVDALLEVSDAGMDALSRHLDSASLSLLDGGPHVDAPALPAPAHERPASRRTGMYARGTGCCATSASRRSARCTPP